MMGTRTPPHAVALALTLLWGCADGDPVVSLDVSLLRAEAALSGARVDRIELAVTAEDLDEPQLKVIDGNADFIDIEVPAGPDRHFTLLAVSVDYGMVVPPYWGDAQGDFAVFWGTTTLDLEARADLLIGMPVFPSGRAEGRGTPGEVVVFTPADPFPDQPASHQTLVDETGSWSIVLPSGSYSFDSQSFDVAQGHVTTVEGEGP